jgi:uncharacterized membrane protein YidH (DUF202 family)
MTEFGTFRAGVRMDRVSERREWVRFALRYLLVGLAIASFGLTVALWIGSSISKEPIDTRTGGDLTLLVLLGVALAIVGVRFVRRSIRPGP